MQKIVKPIVVGSLLLGGASAMAEATFVPDISMVARTDAVYYSKEQNGKNSDFVFDGAEITIGGNVDDYFYAQATTSINESGDVELEEAFADSIGLPYGFGVRAGKMLSNLGVLGPHHPHEDFFTDRPVAYTGSFGEHGGFSDIGARGRIELPTRWANFTAELGAFKGGDEAKDLTGAWEGAFRIGYNLTNSFANETGATWLYRSRVEEHDHSTTTTTTEEHEKLHYFTLYHKARYNISDHRAINVQGEIFYVEKPEDFDEVAESYHKGYYIQAYADVIRRWQVGFRHEQAFYAKANDQSTKRLVESAELRFQASEATFVSLHYKFEHPDSGADLHTVGIGLQVSLGAHPHH